MGGTVVRKSAAALVRLRSGHIEAEALSEPVRIESGRHHVIQFARLPSADEKAQLEELGVTLLGYIPERSFWARIAGDAERVRRTPIAGGLVVARPTSAAMKLDASLSRLGSASGDLAVHFFADASEEELARVSSLLAQTSIKRRGRDYAVIAWPGFALERLSQLDGVQWVEPYVADTRLHSGVGNLQHSVTPLRAEAFSLTGAGVKVAVFDAGWIDASHPDFASRVSFDASLRGVDGYPIGSSTRVGKHATQMAGVIASSGAGNLDAIGVAPGAVLFSYREAYSYENPNAMVLAQSSALGWRIINHSYGSGFPCADTTAEPCKSDPLWTSYIQHAADADTWATQAGVISVYSAGNDGLFKDYPTGWADGNWSTLHSGGAAKNVIAVCAAGKVSKLGETFDVKADSSKGPASDGRVKPDLCALGLPVVDGGINYTTALNGAYTTTQATSGAAAQVTGIVALLMQAYRDVLAQPTLNLPPDLARGALIHSAEDMTEANSYRDWNGVFDSHATPGPDYTTGWGYANAQAAVELLRATTHYRSHSLSNGQLDEYEVTVPAGSPLKVTLAWTDPPASVGAGRALVNDLDLSVSEPESGATYYPWVLDPNLPLQPASTGINVVDNVEQVLFTNTSDVARTYRIAVEGSTVPQGPQAYQLLADYDLGFGGPAATPPAASFVFACSYLGCTFTDQSSDADGTVSAWAWDFGDGTSSSERHPLHGYASAGAYTVTLTVLDNTGLSASSTEQVLVTAPPQPPLASFAATCTDLGCSFTDQSSDSDGTLSAWSWNFGDGSTSSLRHPSHVYASAGTYTVSLTVRDDTDLSASSSSQVITFDPPSPPSAYFTFVCANLECDFTDESTDWDSSIVSWSWNFGDGATSQQRNPRHLFADAGNHGVTLTVTDSTSLSTPRTRFVPVTSCFTATNANHYAAVRATRTGFFSYTYYAAGSGARLGGGSTSTALQGTNSSYFEVVSSCPAPLPFTIPAPTSEQCFTATNSAHFSAGRASRRQQLFTYSYYAVGSNDSLGQTGTTSSLRGAAGSWRLTSSCP
jgi:PKD repeat protein